MAKFIGTIKAIITRLVFASHGFIAIWQVTSFKKNPIYWYLSTPILLLVFEGIFTVTIKTNQEWKWFCPSVFLYLASVVPAIWLLEFDKLDRRMKARETNINISETFDLRNLAAEDLKHLEKAFGVNLKLPEIQISTETWVTLIEQFLMLILIIGRWMLPKGDLSRDQLSQLLLVYIGTAADIIEFFDSFKEDKIGRELVLVYLTLGIWSWSLMQFTVVLTATKSRKSRLSSGTTIKKKVRAETSCCGIDVWAIAINMVLQDAPFLAFRLLIILQYRIVSYMNIFFTCKNTLVILLQLYRLYVVQSETKSRRKRRVNSRHELPSISIVSRNDLYKYESNSRVHRKARDIEKNSSNVDEDSSAESDSNQPPKHLDRSKRKLRQDTGYCTSSSRNSQSKHHQKSHGKVDKHRTLHREVLDEESEPEIRRKFDKKPSKKIKNDHKKKSQIHRMEKKSKLNNHRELDESDDVESSLESSKSSISNDTESERRYEHRKRRQKN